jgi:hypothetical protein
VGLNTGEGEFFEDRALGKGVQKQGLPDYIPGASHHLVNHANHLPVAILLENKPV